MFKNKLLLAVALTAQFVTSPLQAAWGGNSGFGQGDIKVDRNSVDFDERSDNPPTPTGNRGKVFVKDNGGITTPYFIDSSGTVTSMLGGGGASVSDAVYGVAWNGDTTVAPSKNAVYDKIETILAGSGDIESVTAGDGLTGGGVSGAVTLDVVGTADRITVGANAVDIAATYAGQASIVTLGTITTGTWDGTDLTAGELGVDSVSASELNATGVEAELEAVLDLVELQGQIGDAQIADGAVDGGVGGEITDASVTADDLGVDSVSASELNATGVEAELEAVMDLQDMQGAVTDGQVPDTVTINTATLASTVTVADSADDTTTFPVLAGSATGSLAMLTDAGLAYNASTHLMTFGSDVSIGHQSGANARVLATTAGSNALISAFNMNNQNTGSAAGTGMLASAGADTASIGGIGWTRTDASSNSIYGVRVLSNGSLTDADTTSPLYITGAAGGTTVVMNGSLANNVTGTLTLTGTGTLNGLDAIDATGEATLEAALDIAGDVTGTGLGSVVIADNAVDGTDIALGSDAQGDIMYYDGTDWVRLAKGTAGQVLEMNAGATAPEWDTDNGGVDVQTFTSDGTWTKPAGITYVKVVLIGAGGGGAGGRSAADGTARNGGGGGGGGNRVERLFLASALGTTEDIIVGTGGTAGAANLGNGGNGEDSTFGTTVIATAHGGQGGQSSTGGTGAAKQTGGYSATAFSQDYGADGGAGGDGPGNSVEGKGGLTSLYGGAGGGGGSGIRADDYVASPNGGGNGGNVLTITQSTGGGGAGGTTQGTNGSNGTDGNTIKCGTGGGGAVATTGSGTGGVGGNGGALGGGGGGGGAGVTGGTGGVGGRGEVRVYCW